jgi:hypothetical protein
MNAIPSDRVRLVAGSAGESLAELWAARGAIDRAGFEQLVPMARAEAAGVLSYRALELVPRG